MQVWPQDLIPTSHPISLFLSPGEGKTAAAIPMSGKDLSTLWVCTPVRNLGPCLSPPCAFSLSGDCIFLFLLTFSAQGGPDHHPLAWTGAEGPLCSRLASLLPSPPHNMSNPSGLPTALGIKVPGLWQMGAGRQVKVFAQKKAPRASSGPDSFPDAGDPTVRNTDKASTPGGLVIWGGSP